MTDPSSRTQALRAGDIQVEDRIQSTDVPTLQKDSSTSPCQEGRHDRLPGPDDQHRQQERPAEAVLERRDVAREVAVPAHGVRPRARPDDDQQGRLRRAEPARLLPDRAGQPVVQADHEGARVQPARERRRSRRSSSRRRGSSNPTVHLMLGGTDPVDRPARPGDPVDGEGGRHQRRRVDADRVHDVAEPRRRGQRSTRSRSAGRAASTRTATSTASSPRPGTLNDSGYSSPKLDYILNGARQVGDRRRRARRSTARRCRSSTGSGR